MQDVRPAGGECLKADSTDTFYNTAWRIRPGARLFDPLNSSEKDELQLHANMPGLKSLAQMTWTYASGDWSRHDAG